MYKFTCRWTEDEPANEVEGQGISIARAAANLISEIDDCWAVEGDAALEILLVAIAQCVAMFDDKAATHVYRDPSSDDAVVEITLTKTEIVWPSST